MRSKIATDVAAPHIGDWNTVIQRAKSGHADCRIAPRASVFGTASESAEAAKTQVFSPRQADSTSSSAADLPFQKDERRNILRSSALFRGADL